MPAKKSKKSKKSSKAASTPDHLLQGYGNPPIATPMHVNIPQRISPKIKYLMYTGKDDLGDNLYSLSNQTTLEQCAEEYVRLYPNIKNAHVLKQECVAPGLPKKIQIFSIKECKEMSANKHKAARMALIDKYKGAYVYDKHLDKVVPVRGIYTFMTGAENGCPYLEADITEDLDKTIQEYKKIYPKLHDVHFFPCKTAKQGSAIIESALRSAGYIKLNIRV